MTIGIGFHQQRYRTFKVYYVNHVKVYWRSAFPGLVSYPRFVSWLPSVLLPLCAYLKRCFGDCTGVSFLDSTSLAVCHNRRISQHQVFENIAARGKTSVDRFFGFKLHLVVNEVGELLNVTLTLGNTDGCSAVSRRGNRKPVVKLLKPLFGKVFAGCFAVPRRGNRGYVSQSLAQQLLKLGGVEFFAKPKRNMKNRLIRLTDKLLAHKRSIIETIIDQLKSIS